MVKIKDVAEACGVSTATVSRVLANKKYVRPEIRQRVMDAAKALNYKPNRVARSLRSSQSSIIALIVSDIENPFFQRVSRAVEDSATEQGYSVMLCNNDEDQAKEKKYLDLMRAENVAGIILSPSPQTINDFKHVSDLNIPVVVIDRKVKDYQVDSVLIDNAQSSQSIVTHLIEHGYQRIAGIFGMDTTTGMERKEGFLQAFKKKEIKPIPELMTATQPREESGYAAAVKLLNYSKPPDAIFTTNSMLAAGIIRALRERKIAIPEEIAIVSFDEATWTRLLIPALTVIDQPTYEIGRTATELLVKRIKDPERSTREVILQAKMVVRQSCGCP